MAMKRSKRERLEAAGWRVGTAADFLGLSAEESAFVARRAALGSCANARLSWREESSDILLGGEPRAEGMKGSGATMRLALL